MKTIARRVKLQIPTGPACKCVSSACECASVRVETASEQTGGRVTRTLAQEKGFPQIAESYRDSNFYRDPYIVHLNIALSMVVSRYFGGKSHVSNGQNASFKEPCSSKEGEVICEIDGRVKLGVLAQVLFWGGLCTFGSCFGMLLGVLVEVLFGQCC